MGLAQLLNSIAQIRRASHADSARGIARHLMWQVRKLLNGFPTVLRISHSRLYVDRPGGVAALVNSLGAYDRNNMNLIRLLLNQAGAVFFDVGANIGSYTLVASEGPGQVVSVEPHPRTFAALRRNIRLNRRLNVVALNLAASDRRGHLRLTDYPQSATNHVVEDPGSCDHTIEVKAATLDEIVRELAVRPNIVKIDVEGHEARVLDGFVNEISSVDVVLVERGERDAIRRHPALAGFLGPYFFHSDSGTFCPWPQKRKEDSIFVRGGALGRLGACGLRLAVVPDGQETSRKPERSSSGAWPASVPSRGPV